MNLVVMNNVKVLKDTDTGDVFMQCGCGGSLEKVGGTNAGTNADTGIVCLYKDQYGNNLFGRGYNDDGSLIMIDDDEMLELVANNNMFVLKSFYGQGYSVALHIEYGYAAKPGGGESSTEAWRITVPLGLGMEFFYNKVIE